MTQGHRVVRYCFVGGLHRSGTSLVAGLIGGLPGVSAIRDAPVPENEGVYLQGAIPHTAMHGRPLHFATDPAQHHVEGGAFDRAEVRDRLIADWAPWFDPDAAWRVEKSPVNLTRTRLYQQLFPLSQFVVVIRHPQAVAGAMRKWGHGDERAAVDHWIAAHRVLAGDLDHLHAALVLRYEDLVARPDAWRGALARFLDLRQADAPPDRAARDGAVRDGNADYAPYGPLPPDRDAALAQWGYAGNGTVLPLAPLVRHPLRAIRDGVLAALA